jgi:hypothetical protein
MPNARSMFGVIIAGIALALGAVGVVTYYHLRFQEEHDPQLVAEITTKRKNDQLDAITTAFLKKMSRESSATAQPNIAAICIGESANGHRGLAIDARPEILARLKKTTAKVQPYSYCKTLPRGQDFFIYWLDSFEQESDEDVSVGIGFRDNLDGMYQDGSIINMKKRNGKWELGIEGPGWIS